MDIRIVKSELRTVASADLSIDKDLEKLDASLKDTLEQYGENTEEEETGSQ